MKCPYLGRFDVCDSNPEVSILPSRDKMIRYCSAVNYFSCPRFLIAVGFRPWRKKKIRQARAKAYI